MAQTRNTPKRRDTEDRDYVLAVELWFNYHRDRWNADEQTVDEICRRLKFGNGYNLPGLAELCRTSETIPTRKQVDDLRTARMLRGQERKRTAARLTAQPTDEERAQMDALLAKFPNLIQRKQSAPTLFNY